MLFIFTLLSLLFSWENWNLDDSPSYWRSHRNKPQGKSPTQTWLQNLSPQTLTCALCLLLFNRQVLSWYKCWKCYKMFSHLTGVLNSLPGSSELWYPRPLIHGGLSITLGGIIIKREPGTGPAPRKWPWDKGPRYLVKNLQMLTQKSEKRDCYRGETESRFVRIGAGFPEEAGIPAREQELGVWCRWTGGG